MDSVAVAAAVKNRISQLGGNFMLSQQAKAAGKALNAGGWGFYMIGRGAVFGDNGPEPVHAAFGFFPLERVRTGWERGRAALHPDEARGHYLGVCHTWARDHLSEAEGLERLAELLGAVVAAAPGEGRPLYAGWARQPLSYDPRERVAQLAFYLREHRGGSHLLATVIGGLTPLQAVLLGGGEGNADFFGWEGPYEDVSGLGVRRMGMEQFTDTLAAEAWAALDDAETTECIALLESVGDSAAASVIAAQAAAS